MFMERIESKRACAGIAWSFVLVASGCIQVGPDYAPPAVPLADAWINSTPSVTIAPGADPASWWERFGDPVMHHLVELARERNPSLRAAGLRVLEARARRGIAVGGLFPQSQDATASYQETRISELRPNAFPGIDLTTDDWRAGFDAAWEIDLWGRFRRSVESADASLLGAEASREDVLVSLVAEVASNYVQLRTLERRLTVARENVAVQSRGFEIADARYRGGAVTALDASQAASLLAETKALIPELEGAIRKTRNTLSILLGLPPSDLASELSGEHPIPVAPADLAIGVPADLLRARPDVRAAERALAAQSAQIGVATAALYPHLSLVGSLGFEAEHVADVADGRALTHFGGPSVRWAILNYGRISNAVRVEDARYQQALAAYESTVLAAQAEVENALASLAAARGRVTELERAAQAARRAVELAGLQYKEGAVDYTRVLDTQQVLVAVEDRLAASQGDVALGITALYKALGGGSASMPVGRVDAVPPVTPEEVTGWRSWLPNW